MADRLVVIGAGGFGRETLDVVEAINAAAAEPVWQVVGVIDDDPARIQLERLAARGYQHLGGLETAEALAADAVFVIGIGSPVVRARIAGQLDAVGARFATLVHPAAVLGSQSWIGTGAVVCGGAQLSTNIRLGAHVHVNPGAIIGHDSTLADFVSINPGAIISGEVQVRHETLIGAGAVVLQGLEVGTGALVGASACVTRDVPAHSTVKGVPAR